MCTWERHWVCVCLCVCVFACSCVCGKRWKRCQLDVGVQTDGRQASGQLAFTAFHKPFPPTTSPPYPHSVILAFALFLLFSLHSREPGWEIKHSQSNYKKRTYLQTDLKGALRGTKNQKKISPVYEVCCFCKKKSRSKFLIHLHGCMSVCSCACNSNTRPANLNWVRHLYLMSRKSMLPVNASLSFAFSFPFDVLFSSLGCQIRVCVAFYTRTFFLQNHLFTCIYRSKVRVIALASLYLH